MKISQYSTVKLSYRLTDAHKGEILQEIAHEAPSQFSLGKGNLLDSFEINLIGLQENDIFSFVIPSNEAYGPIDPMAIFDVPLSTFANDDGSFDEGVLMPGNIFPMEDREGNRHYGKMIKIMDESVTMDFNHPLAGKDLKFEGKITKIVDQTNP